jgi:isoquinoline 1-oxidoreductase beta subunit
VPLRDISPDQEGNQKRFQKGIVMKLMHVSRRNFLKATGLSASGLLLGFRWSHGKGDAFDSSLFAPNAFINISPEEGIQIFISIPEIGQNIRTAIAMIIADELGAELDSVTLRQAAPNDKMGRMTAGASASVRTQYSNWRQAAATAREILISAAADLWEVRPSDCRTGKNSVIGPDSRIVSFSDLVERAVALPVPSHVSLKPDADLKLVGSPQLCMDSRSIVTGREVFGIDAFPENLAFAVMVRCPVYKGVLKGFDATAAQAMPGVKAVFEADGKVAVVATTTWAAINASRLVKAEWDAGPFADADTDSIEQAYANGVRTASEVNFSKGDFDRSFEDCPIQLDEEFSVPIIAHAPLEPPNCAVWFHDGAVEIWGSSQSLNTLYRKLPELTGLEHDRITYHQLRIGGGFGRKLALDYIEEAIAIARQLNYPVKLTFTREDDIRHDVYRLGDHRRYRIGLGEKGFPAAIEETTMRPGKPGVESEIVRMFSTGIMKQSVLEDCLPWGYLRAPGHNVTTFTEQSMIDIMARRSGIDEVSYQLALHGDEGTLNELGWPQSPYSSPPICELLRIVRTRSDWKSDDSLGYGLATFSGYGSHAAMVATVRKRNPSRPVEQVFIAVDCGTVINPLGAHAQIEGGIIDALGAALYQKITLKAGRVVQGNFHDFKLLRIAEHPDIDIFFRPSVAPPQGLGEVSYPLVAPAAANALFAATGERKIKLPLRP